MKPGRFRSAPHCGGHLPPPEGSIRHRAPGRPLGEIEADGADAAVSVDDGLFTCQSRHAAHLLVQHLGLHRVHLEKRMG